MGCILKPGIKTWNNKRIPYIININSFASADQSAMQTKINNAIQHWRDNTNYLFVQRSNEQDFVCFQGGEGCSSPVGKRGGGQNINLASGCSESAVIHEIGHAIGMKHEHTRKDRNNFVTIILGKVLPDKRHNYKKSSGSDYLDFGPYDYSSIMHYKNSSFLNNQRYDWSNGWTSCNFYEIGGVLYVFFLKEHDGTVHTHVMDASVGIVRKIETHDWSSGWSNVEFFTINNRVFSFFLKTGNGVVNIHEMKGDGTVGRKVGDHDWSSGWTTAKFYTIGGKNFMFFLKVGNGVVNIHEMNGNGTVGRLVDEYDWSSGWTSVEFYTIGSKTFGFFLKAGNGVVNIHEMNGNGTVGRLVDEYDWSSGWTSVEFYTIGSKTFGFFLKAGNGVVNIHEMNGNGTVGRLVDEYDWSSGWTTTEFYTIGGNNFMFFLKAGNGIVHMQKMKDDGTVGGGVKVLPPNIVSPVSIGGRTVLSAGDIAAANAR